MAAAGCGTVQYWSKTHSTWITARVVAEDTRTGAFQIDKKPREWLLPGDPRVRQSPDKVTSSISSFSAEQLPGKAADGISYTRSVERPTGITSGSIGTRVANGSVSVARTEVVTLTGEATAARQPDLLVTTRNIQRDAATVSSTAANAVPTSSYLLGQSQGQPAVSPSVSPRPGTVAAQQAGRHTVTVATTSGAGATVLDAQATTGGVVRDVHSLDGTLPPGIVYASATASAPAPLQPGVQAHTTSTPAVAAASMQHSSTRAAANDAGVSASASSTMQAPGGHPRVLGPASMVAATQPAAATASAPAAPQARAPAAPATVTVTSAPASQPPAPSISAAAAPSAQPPQAAPSAFRAQLDETRAVRREGDAAIGTEGPQRVAELSGATRGESRPAGARSWDFSGLEQRGASDPSACNGAADARGASQDSDQESPSRSAGLQPPSEPTPMSVRYRCPTCGEMCDTMSEAVEHCAATTKGAAQPAGAQGAEAKPSQSPTASEDDFPAGECIAYDGKGRPMIVRQVDDETGSARTCVRNEDDSHSVFGENTVASLTKASEPQAYEWAAALTQVQLRGLVHEVGQRLLGQSQLYHSRLKELDKMGAAINYLYFGLSPESSEKDIEKAYRQKARQMHPDKNGGTEEAKKRFQEMKERYEAIKKQRATFSPRGEERGAREQDDDEKKLEGESRGHGRKQEQEDNERHDTKEEEEDQTPNESGGADADRRDGESEGSPNSRSPKGKRKGKMDYDPKDKDSMVEAVGRMVAQLKTIDTQMEVLVAELDRVHAQIPPGMYD